MDRSALERVCREVTRSFPELEGARPTLRRQPTPSGETQYLLVFKAQVALPGGRTLARVVRVVADARGGIVRISTSR